jgi:ribosomal protein S18 acetylase RimI-like enzyme
MNQRSETRFDISITLPDSCSDELSAAMGRLLAMLSSSAPVPDRAAIERIIASDSTLLFVARASERIVGVLTLVVFDIPTGRRAWIEDVVVDEAARGRGVGERLMRAAMDHAARRGARTIDLTSRPGREAANRLYRRLGFELRETNVYRYRTDMDG